MSETDDGLMSHPTLSGLENAPSSRELGCMELSLIDVFCDSFTFVPERIVLEIDDILPGQAITMARHAK